MKTVVFVAVLLLACTRTTPVNTPTVGEGVEPGLWAVCYSAEGEIDNLSGECEHPQEVTWTFPVRVHVPRDYAHRLRLLEALVAWNEWLGVEVFLATENKEAANVVIKIMADNPMFAGLADHKLVDGKPYFTVYLADKYADRVDIVAHEFGHVLGLAHDPGRKRSIMHPGAEWYLPRLSAHDCKILTKKYKLKKATCNAPV